MAGSPVRTSTTPGITINKSRESLSSESDLTELSLSPEARHGSSRSPGSQPGQEAGHRRPVGAQRAEGWRADERAQQLASR